MSRDLFSRCLSPGLTQLFSIKTSTFQEPSIIIDVPLNNVQPDWPLSYTKPISEETEMTVLLYLNTLRFIIIKENLKEILWTLWMFFIHPV